MLISDEQHESALVIWGQDNADSRFAGLDLYRKDCHNLLDAAFGNDATVKLEELYTTFCSGTDMHYMTLSNKDLTRTVYLTDEERTSCYALKFDSSLTHLVTKKSSKNDEELMAYCKGAEAYPMIDKEEVILPVYDEGQV